VVVGSSKNEKEMLQVSEAPSWEQSIPPRIGARI